MTFEERKEINRLVKQLPPSTYVLLEAIQRWSDYADIELELGAELELDDPASDILGINATNADLRVLCFVKELITSGSLAVLLELSRVSRSAE